MRIAQLFGVSPTPDAEEAPKELELKGDNAEESSELGALSVRVGQYEKAIEHYKRSIEQREPNDPQGRIDLGGVYEAIGMEPMAFRQYEKAIRAQRANSEAYAGMSDLYKRYGRFRDSIAQLETAAELEPHNPYYHLKIAEACREMGERDRALMAIQHAVTCAPDRPFYFYWMGDLLIEMKRYGEALDALQAAIELSPGDDFLFSRAAVAFWGAGKKVEAIKSIRMASDLDPSKLAYRGMIELMLRETDQPEEAKLEHAVTMKLDPWDRDIVKRLADELGVKL